MRIPGARMETRSSPPPPSSPWPPPSPLGPLHLPARGLQACLHAHRRKPGLPKQRKFGSLPTQSRSLLQVFPSSAAPVTSSTPMMSRRRNMWTGMVATSYAVVNFLEYHMGVKLGSGWPDLGPLVTIAQSKSIGNHVSWHPTWWKRQDSRVEWMVARESWLLNY